MLIGAAGGVGTIGIADFDHVEEHNLQRQLLHDSDAVGQPKVVFNAHRVFRARDIVADFDDLELLEFSLVHDDGTFTENVPLETSDTQRYACGCFLFRKRI